MSSGEVRVDQNEIRRFTRDVFEKVGMPPEDAEIEADVLLWANLRGVDSHGVLRIPLYLTYLEIGSFNPNPNITVVNETAATMLIDADQALGPVVTKMATERAIDKARDAGIGWAVIRKTCHQGAMGYYSLMAAEQEMVGFASVSGPPNMVPHGATLPGVHNSPIAIGVPAKRHRPMVLDMATSVVAGGKIDLQVDRGLPLPLGWLVDEDGKPTTDPQFRDRMVPIGGPKGSGLALMLECMSSLMVGNPILAPKLAGEEVPRGSQNSTIAAINIAAFTDVDAYKENVDKTIDGLKALPTAEGVDEVFVPGEPEDRVYDDRLRNGVPLPKGTLDKLRAVSERLGVPLFEVP